MDYSEPIYVEKIRREQNDAWTKGSWKICIQFIIVSYQASPLTCLPKTVPQLFIDSSYVPNLFSSLYLDEQNPSQLSHSFFTVYGVDRAP